MSFDSFDPRFNNWTPSPPLSPFHRLEQNIEGKDGRDFNGICESSHSVNSSVFACDSSSEDDEGMNAFGGLGGSWDSDQKFDKVGLNSGDSGGHDTTSVSHAGLRVSAPPINAAESLLIKNEGISMASIEVQEDLQTVRSNHRAIGTLAPPDDVNVHLLQNFESAASEIINFECSDMVHNNPYSHSTSSANKNNSNSNGSNSTDLNTNSAYSIAMNNSNPKFRSLGPNTGSSAEIQGNHFDLTTMSKASPFFYGDPASRTVVMGSPSHYQRYASENVNVNTTSGGSTSMGFWHQQSSEKNDIIIITNNNNDLNDIGGSIDNNILDEMNNGNGMSYLNMSLGNNSVNDSKSSTSGSVDFQGTQVITRNGTSSEAISQTTIGSSYAGGISGVNDVIRRMIVDKSTNFAMTNTINSSCNCNMNTTTINTTNNSNICIICNGNIINASDSCSSPAVRSVGSKIIQTTRFNERAKPEATTDTAGFSSIAMEMETFLSLHRSLDGASNTGGTCSNEVSHGSVKNDAGENNVGINNVNVNTKKIVNNINMHTKTSDDSYNAMHNPRSVVGSVSSDLNTNIQSIKHISESISEVAPSLSVMTTSLHNRPSTDATTNIQAAGINPSTNYGMNSFIDPNTRDSKNSFIMKMPNSSAIKVFESRSLTSSIGPNAVYQGIRRAMSGSISESTAPSSMPVGMEPHSPHHCSPGAMTYVDGSRNVGNSANQVAGNEPNVKSSNNSGNRDNFHGKNAVLTKFSFGPDDIGYPMLRRDEPSRINRGTEGVWKSSLIFEGGSLSDTMINSSTHRSGNVSTKIQCHGNNGCNSDDSFGKSDSPYFSTTPVSDFQRNDGGCTGNSAGTICSEGASCKKSGDNSDFLTMHMNGEDGRSSAFSSGTYDLDKILDHGNDPLSFKRSNVSAAASSKFTIGPSISVRTETPKTDNGTTATKMTNDQPVSNPYGLQYSLAASVDCANSSSTSMSRHDTTRRNSPRGIFPLGTSTFSSSAGFIVDDNIVDTPVIVHRSANTTIYRQQDRGIKVLSSNSSGTDQGMSISSYERKMKLQHEQTISQKLPPTCHKRHVLGITIFHGQTALVFKWANGITLKEWIRKMQLHSQADLEVRLNAALAIVATLRQFHENGVVYNHLTIDNIVLNASGGNYDATFIDLQEAVDINDVGGGADEGAGLNGSDPVDPLVVKTMKRVDLVSLGDVLNELFQGDIGASDEVTTRSDIGNQDRKKRGKKMAPGEGLPLYLRSLISALLLSSGENADTECYENVDDVFTDLQVLIRNRNLQKYSPDDTGHRLKLDSEIFYGRQVQMLMLMDLFQSVLVLGDQPMIAIIAGGPGTGKSTLVNQIKKPLEEKGGRFIEGKFVNLRQPDVVLTAALDTFFGILLDKSRDNPKQMMLLRWRIHDAIGSGSDALLNIIPNLQKLMTMGDGNNPSSHSTRGDNTSKCRGDIGIRMKYMLVKLIGALSHRSHPLVLFLDDLQWADAMTLDVIRAIMTDPDIKHFLFIGCYRDSEVGFAHPLTSSLNYIQDQGINVVTIKLGKIEKECVNSLVSDALCLPPSLCVRLSTVVHRKTGGIMLFVLKFLKSLNEEGLLWFSMSSRSWEFDLNRIKVKEISDDVVVHMTNQMSRLSKRMQAKLKCCACLGPCFDTEILRKAIRETDFNINSFLESSLEDGFFQHIADDRYKWAHDQVQQAAYELIPFASRESFHLLLGSRIFVRAPSNELGKLVYFIVDNMNRGSRLLESSDQKIELARLNLRAGEKAMLSSAFHSAAKYLQKGLSLLAMDSWETHYTLTLQLYDAISEALFVTGDFVKLSDLIDEPLRHARCFEDKLNIYNNYVRSLIASGNYEECLEMCISILLQLGEIIPTEVTKDIYANEVAEVKKSLEGKNRDDLLCLPTMLDTSKLAAMQFLNHALTLSFVFKPTLNPIVVFRMVEISIQHGVCNLSAFAFACYGGWLVSFPTYDFDGGYTMGLVANDLMKMLNATEIIPRLYSTVYGFINIWKEPFQACLGKHVEAAEVGESIGDMEFSTTNLMLYVNMAIYGCGTDLPNLEKDIQVYMRRAIRCNQIMLIKNMAILYQLTLDLMGFNHNAFSLYHPGMSEETCFADAHQNNHSAICRLICVKRKYVAFWMGRMDTAARMYELHKKYSNTSTGRLVSIINSSFVDGMIAFYFARKHGDDEEEWTVLGESTIQTWSQWAECSSWNFVNKLYLLEAEYAFLKKDDETAIAKYNASIKAARDHKFNHEEGLAEEKAATYLLHMSRHNEALAHFKNAKTCYEKWGAAALVERVETAISVLSPLCVCP